jgi:transposase
MESGVIGINQRELQRYHVLRMVLAGKMTLLEASVVLGVSYRHAKRLKEDAREGVNALLHGNRGRTPWNKTADELREQILVLSKEKYSDFNDTHFTEMLGLREDIAVSRETVRSIRREGKVKPKQKRRVVKHHKRRPRKEQAGMMMLWDGSPHRWFGKGNAACCLMAAIDDATSEVLALLFTECECSWGYFELLRRIVSGYGIPLSVYQDRHSSLKRNDSFWSIDEQFNNRQEPTQVGLALEALGIEAITAITPQAKGRVERLFKTLQDRLVAMLGLEGITSIEEANSYIDSTFLGEFNSQFAEAAEVSESAFRKVRRRLDVTRILSYRYEATVGNDNAVRLGGMVIDVPPGPGGRSYAKAKVEVRQTLDGSWRVYHDDRLIADAPASTVAEPIRARRRRKGSRAALDASWVYYASAPAQTSGDAKASTAAGTASRAKPGRTIGATRIA